jgi:hypothetical protein
MKSSRALDRPDPDAGAIVLNGDHAIAHRHADLRRHPCLLGRVEGVVDQFVEHDKRPALRLLPSLNREFFAGAKFQQSAGLEGRALLYAHFSLARRQDGRPGKARQSVWSVKSVIQHCYLRALPVRRRR